MNNKFLKKLAIILTVCAAGAVMILTVKDLSYAQNIKTENGLNFNVPDDWPIEKRGGILGPIPTEEYILIKFTEAEEELQAMKDDLTSKFEELQSNIDNVEVNFTKEIQKVQAQAGDQTGAGEDLSDVLTSLASLESELGRLDRKITNKVAEMKGEYEETAIQLRSVEKKIETLLAHVQKLYREIGYSNEK